MINRILLTAGILLAFNANAVETSASIQWANKRELGLPISGVVKQIDQPAGSYAKKDQSILSLDCGLYNADFQRKNAIAKGLEPAVETALKEKELADELFARTVLSVVEHRKAELEYLEIKSRHEAAKSAATKARWAQQHCILKADQNLIILSVKIKTGEMYSLEGEKPQLATVASSNSLSAVGKFSLPHDSGLKPGAKAQVKVAGQTYNAKITAMDYSSDHVMVEVTFEHFDAALVGNTSATLIIK